MTQARENLDGAAGEEYQTVREYSIARRPFVYSWLSFVDGYHHARRCSVRSV
jgi:hypothetical protein